LDGRWGIGPATVIPRGGRRRPEVTLLGMVEADPEAALALIEKGVRCDSKSGTSHMVFRLCATFATARIWFNWHVKTLVAFNQSPFSVSVDSSIILRL
jgi:hypothetical protein